MSSPRSIYIIELEGSHKSYPIYDYVQTINNFLNQAVEKAKQWIECSYPLLNISLRMIAEPIHDLETMVQVQQMNSGADQNNESQREDDGPRVITESTQITHEQPPATVADIENQLDQVVQDHDMVTTNNHAISIGLGLMGMSAAFLGAILVPVIESKEVYFNHKYLFMAYISFTLVSFISAVLLLLLPLCQQYISGLVMIIKFTIRVSTGAILSAFVCGCFIVFAGIHHQVPHS